MTLYQVKWCRCPTAYNTTQLTYIEAPDAESARIVAKDHIQRACGVEWYNIDHVTEYTPPSAALGRVVTNPTN